MTMSLDPALNRHVSTALLAHHGPVVHAPEMLLGLLPVSLCITVRVLELPRGCVVSAFWVHLMGLLLTRRRGGGQNHTRLHRHASSMPAPCSVCLPQIILGPWLWQTAMIMLLVAAAVTCMSTVPVAVTVTVPFLPLCLAVKLFREQVCTCFRVPVMMTLSTIP